MEMPDNAYQMQDVRWVSGIFSVIDLMYAGAISMPEMPKKCPFMLIFREFKYKMVSKWYAGYGILDAKCETSFRHSFRHWFNVCRSNLSAWNAKNVHLCRFSAYLSTKWYPKEMLDITFQMRDVRRVSGIVSGIDLIYSGAIYRIRITRNDHLYRFPMYLSTNGTWWKCRIIDSRCELWDEFPA